VAVIVATKPEGFGRLTLTCPPWPMSYRSAGSIWRCCRALRCDIGRSRGKSMSAALSGMEADIVVRTFSLHRVWQDAVFLSGCRNH
jgi:hypothetical protein